MSYEKFISELGAFPEGECVDASFFDQQENQHLRNAGDIDYPIIINHPSANYVHIENPL